VQQITWSRSFSRSYRRAGSASTQPGKLLSLQFWRNDEAVRRWRNQELHRRVQQAGRKAVFADYRLQVAQLIRSYGKYDRAEAPADSKAAHGV
jgi:heme-degrading monooxygenase HmoA